MNRIRKQQDPPPTIHLEIPAAGRAVHIDHGSAKACFDWNHHVPYTKKSLLDPIQHMPGKLAPNVTAVSEKARKLIHGVRGAYKYTAGDVLFPPRPHALLMEREARRESIYHRREHQVLGAAVPNATKLPEFTKEPDFKFGISTKEDDDVRVIMYPPKTESVDPNVRKQYILSHNSYEPGERRMHYGSDWQMPEKDDGNPLTRYDNDGKRVRDSLYWDEQRQEELKSKLISKRLADFRERTQPELGKVHDPMKDTLAHLPSDHTFGIAIPPDEYSVGQLIGSGKTPSKSSVRKKYIPNSPAGIPTRHEHPIDPARRQTLNRDSSVVVDITSDIPGGTLNTRVLKGFDLNHVFGVPTVRAPRGPIAKRLADDTNYGDELDAKGLIYPTPLHMYGREQLAELEKQLQHITLNPPHRNPWVKGDCTSIVTDITADVPGGTVNTRLVEIARKYAEPGIPPGIDRQVASLS